MQSVEDSIVESGPVVGTQQALAFGWHGGWGWHHGWLERHLRHYFYDKDGSVNPIVVLHDIFCLENR